MPMSIKRSLKRYAGRIVNFLSGGSLRKLENELRDIRSAVRAIDARTASQDYWRQLDHNRMQAEILREFRRSHGLADLD